MGEINVLRQRRTLLAQLGKTVFGLAVFSFGLHLTIDAEIGQAPWDVLATGISLHTPLSYGLALTGISLLLLAVDLLMKERIGLGTILDALLVGNLTDLFLLLHLVPAAAGRLFRVAIFLIGLCIMALGQYFYMSAGQGCGPRDSFLIAVGKRMRRVPIGVVNMLIFAAVFALGWLFGGPIGIGTALSVLLLGPMIQLVCRLFHFEPRSVAHQDLQSALRILIGR